MSDTDRKLSQMLTAALHSPNFAVRLLHQAPPSERAEVVRRWSQTSLAALPASPVAALPASPVAALPASPVAALPASPVAALPASPVAALPASPVAALPARPLAAVAAAPALPGLRKCVTPVGTQSQNMAVQLAAFARSVRRVG